MIDYWLIIVWQRGIPGHSSWPGIPGQGFLIPGQESLSRESLIINRLIDWLIIDCLLIGYCLIIDWLLINHWLICPIKLPPRWRIFADRSFFGQSLFAPFHDMRQPTELELKCTGQDRKETNRTEFRPMRSCPISPVQFSSSPLTWTQLKRTATHRTQFRPVWSCPALSCPGLASPVSVLKALSCSLQFSSIPLNSIEEDRTNMGGMITRITVIKLWLLCLLRVRWCIDWLLRMMEGPIIDWLPHNYGRGNDWLAASPYGRGSHWLAAS